MNLEEFFSKVKTYEDEETLEIARYEARHQGFDLAEEQPGLWVALHAEGGFLIASYSLAYLREAMEYYHFGLTFDPDDYYDLSE